MKEKPKKSLIKILIPFCIFLVFLTICLVKYEKKYHTSLPFQLNSSNLPFIKMKIENNLYPIEINIGSRSPLLLDKNVLEKLYKKRIKKTEKWWDAKGDLYYFSSYIIPKLEIQDMNFKNITAWEENKELSKATALLTDEDIIKNDPLGMTGSFLRKYNLLFDFEKKLFCISNNKRKLKKLGYDLKDFLKIPFEICPYGIKINSYNDLGIKTLLLTTGSTINMLRPSSFIEEVCDKEIHGMKVFTTTKFALEYVTFNKPKFFLINFDEKVPVDGVLGMEFLSRHIFYIDFKNKNIYFKK